MYDFIVIAKAKDTNDIEFRLVRTDEYARRVRTFTGEFLEDYSGHEFLHKKLGETLEECIKKLL